MAFFAGQTVQAASWDGTGDSTSFEDGFNWDDDDVTFADGTRAINGAFTVTRDVDITVERTFVEGGATLNVTSGTHSDNRAGNTIRNFVGRGSLGVVNHSGGSYDIGHLLSIGGGGASGDGSYYLTGGSLAASRGANGANLSDAGGFSLEVGGNGGGDGLFEISGGSFETRIGVGIGASGTFSILGSDATNIGIGSNGSLDGGWVQYSGGTLSAAIDAGGVTKILIDDVDGTSGVNVDFQAGSLLELGFDGIAPTAGTWTLLEAENTAIDASNLSLSGATAAGWSFAVDNTGSNGQLNVTYVPEPSSLALLALGGIAVLRRRR